MFFLKLNCVHDGGTVYARIDAINELRVVHDDNGEWVRLQMDGSPAIEVKETALEVLQMIETQYEDDDLED